MKVSVCSLILPEFTFEEQVGMLRDFGYDGIEIRVCDIAPEHRDKPYSNWGNHKDPIGPSNLAASAPRLKSAAAAVGVEICALGTYVNLRDPAGFDAIAASAVELGARMVRVNLPWYDGREPYDALLELATAGLETVEASAKRHGVKAVLEIHHGSIAPSASAARRLLEGFDPEAAGAILDPGNMVHEGFESWAKGMDILGPYLAHVHVKNATWVLKDKPAGGPFVWEPRTARLREGHANWRAILTALRAAGYEGWYSIEDFADMQTREKLEDDLAFLKALAA
ncbi:MAG: sugar phosphate isomerase/epimerase [Elusimicrobia bacterium]|nr:sugar phosphate isomerase/epimerase [Elusimicrobiota bacterium]